MKGNNQIKLIVFFFLMFIGIVLSARHAWAEGYITGTVKDATTSLPIQGIYVDAFEVNFGNVSTGCVTPRPLETNVTNASGQYGFCVWQGIYKLYFRGMNSYAGRWYGSSSFFGATPVVVRDGQAFTIDRNLYATGGAQLSGKVTGPGNTGLDGVNVTVFDSGQTVESKHGLATATTDGNGNYAIPSLLTPGSYKVKCNDQTGGNNHLPEWWNDKTDIGTADPLTVVSVGPNTANCQLATGGIISGKVNNWINTPINGAQITVYDPNQKSAYTTTTDASGNYWAKRLRSGPYKVLFKGPYDSSWAYEWYNNQHAFSEGQWVSVTAGSETPQINARLFTGGTITGMVGVSGALVKVYDQYRTMVALDISEPDGSYSVPGLPTGQYKVEFVKYDLASTWYMGHRTYDSGGWVAVTAGNTTAGINGSLAGGLTITGTVTNKQGKGIPRVTVRTYDDATLEPLNCTDGTDSLGEYAIHSVSSGKTRVFFDAQGTGYFPEWWDDKKSMAEATPITIAFGTVYPEIDAQLDPSQEVYFPLMLNP